MEDLKMLRRFRALWDLGKDGEAWRGDEEGAKQGIPVMEGTETQLPLLPGLWDASTGLLKAWPTPGALKRNQKKRRKVPKHAKK